jgi:hypothetical protein
MTLPSGAAVCYKWTIKIKATRRHATAQKGSVALLQKRVKIYYE